MAGKSIATVAAGFVGDLARHGDADALVADGGAWSYTRLAAAADRIAEELGPVRRLVAVELGLRVDSVVAYLGALRGGHVALVLPPGAAGERIAAAYDPDVVVTGDAGLEVRRPGTAHELHPDLQLLLSTSGSTGRPKLVRLGADGVDHNARSIASSLGLRRDDRAVTTLPLHYCYGLSVLHSHLAVGASVALQSASVSDPAFWRTVDEVEATNFAGVPHTFDLLERGGFADLDVPTLRFVTQAGGRMDPAKVRRWAEAGAARGWELVVMYGQTEATARMAYLPPALASSRPTAVGVAVPGGSFRVDGASGELVYRGPNVMLGYAATPDDLALGREVEELRTGDLGRIADDGLVEVTGRRRRIAKVFGVRLDLDDVEARLADAGFVALCAGDDELVAVAVVRSSADRAAELVGRTTGLPPRVVVAIEVDELPRLPSGKPDRVGVLTMAHAEVEAWGRLDGGDSDGGGGGGSVDELRRRFAAALGRTVGADDSFVSAGGDSLSYVELSVLLEDRLGHLPPDWTTRTVAELASSATDGRHRRRATLETTVALRALAIVTIVATHTRLVHLVGGAHVLLAVAGCNFARFQRRSGRTTEGIVRLALPVACWLAPVAVVSDRFDWSHVAFVHALVGDPRGRWAYWFVEALLQLLVMTALLLRVPAIRRLDRRSPFLLALSVAGVGLAVRFDVVGLGPTDHRIARAPELLWLFGLGWLAAVATTTRQRLLVSAATIAATYGFFGQGGGARECFVAIGVLALTWVDAVPVPAALRRPAAVLASASLWIYLTHWQVAPPVIRTFGVVPAFVVSIAVGVVAQAVWDGVSRRAWVTASAISARSAGSSMRPPERSRR